jgi:hypothetical protein
VAIAHTRDRSRHFPKNLQIEGYAWYPKALALGLRAIKAASAGRYRSALSAVEGPSAVRNAERLNCFLTGPPNLGTLNKGDPNHILGARRLIQSGTDRIHQPQACVSQNFKKARKYNSRAFNKLPVSPLLSRSWQLTALFSR